MNQDWDEIFSLDRAVMLAALLLIPFSSSVAQAQRARMIYVSDRGNDTAGGLAPQNPLRTLDKALTIAHAVGGPATISLSGRFLFTAPLRLTAADRDLSLTSSNRAEIVAAPNVTTGIYAGGSDRLTISGLVLSNFTGDGIYVANAQGVRVLNNIVRNTTSSSWSRGAIHFTGKVVGGRIANNVIEGADYTGIVVDTNKDSDVSNLQISENTVKDVCRKVADCGAIYVNDRGKRSKNIIISNNIIQRFGNPSTKGRAIYIDDFASNVVASHNKITGPGSYAFQIHGGHDNKIVSNSIDMGNIEQAILYQPPAGSTSWESMSNNVFSQNVLIGTQSKKLIQGMSRLISPGSSMLRVSKNRWQVSKNSQSADD